MGTKRRLTRSNAERLHIAEELRASGVAIEIPKEWHEEGCPFEIMVAPPPDSFVRELPHGLVCYFVNLRCRARESGLTFPEFEIENDWDQVVLESFDEAREHVEFGGYDYQREEILNPQIENNRPFPRGGIVRGWLLATGVRRIPVEYRDFDVVPFVLILRDQFSGEVIHRVQAQLSVSRSSKRAGSAVRKGGGLYGGIPRPISIEEESRQRYREMLAQKDKESASKLPRTEIDLAFVYRGVRRALESNRG